MKLLYCYGVVGKQVSIEHEGMYNTKVYTLPFKDIFAVVSDVPEEQFSQEAIDKNVKNMQWLAHHAPMHETVVSAIMHKTAILPMKFCTIFKDKPHVEQILTEKYGDVKYFLHHTEGKVEMSLKVYANFAELRNQVKEQSPDIRNLQQEAASKTPGQAYFVQQKIDVLLKDKVRQQILGEKKKIMDKIKELFIEIKKNDVLARKITGKQSNIEMVLNLALLVHKNRLAELNGLVDELKKKLVLYTVELTGPFAPYNFIK